MKENDLYGSEGFDDEGEEDDYDEEIERIPVDQAQQQDGSDVDEEAMDYLDDSVSSEEDKRQKGRKAKSKKKKAVLEEDAKPRGYDKESEDMDSDEEEVSEGALRKKLAEDSDEENEL